ncbi:MAG TPA: hypothetical protein VF814_08665 [Casimicrobiaceae bacterium]
MTAKKSARGKKKPKRLARDSDRAYAAELARRYRTQERWRETILGREYEYVVTGDTLATQLEIFAARGTWETDVLTVVADSGVWKIVPSTDDVRAKFDREALNDDFAKLRARGLTPGEALNKLIENSGKGEQTVRDAIYKRSRKKKSP